MRCSVAYGQLERRQAAVQREIQERFGGEGVQIVDRKPEGLNEFLPTAEVV